MGNERIVNGLTLTILVKSPVALSNDQGYGGTYIPIKKTLLDGVLKPFASVSTFTYEMRKVLRDMGWKMSDIVIKKKNLFFKHIEDENDEADLFGYVIATKGQDKTTIVRKSPMRVIPLIAVNKYRNTTQLITNRGFLDPEFGRTYFKEDNKGKQKQVTNIEDIPTAQALVTEEVHGDYYTFTVTLELNRIGRKENDKNRRLEPKDFKYKSPEKRIKIVSDTLEALKIICRDIKHQNPLLRPLTVVGGVFESPIPYFWDRIKILNGSIWLRPLKNTIDDYKLTEKGYVFIGIDDDEFPNMPNSISLDNNQTISIKRPIPVIDEIKDLLKCDKDQIQKSKKVLYISLSKESKDQWILKTS